MVKPRIVLLIFVSGKVVLTGEKSQLTMREDAKSKPEKFSKITNWVKLKNKQTAPRSSTAQQLSNEWLHFRFLPIDSKVKYFVSPKVSLWKSKGKEYFKCFQITDRGPQNVVKSSVALLARCSVFVLTTF